MPDTSQISAFLSLMLKEEKGLKSGSRTMLYRRYSLNNPPTMCGSKRAWGHILWLGEVRRSSHSFVNLSCALVGLVLVPLIGFCFVGVAFFPSASWPLSFLSLFFLFLQPCLIHARLPDWGGAFVHWHTFLHSWSGHVRDIGSRPAALSLVILANEDETVMHHTWHSGH